MGEEVLNIEFDGFQVPTPKSIARMIPFGDLSFALGATALSVQTRWKSLNHHGFVL